MARAESRPRNPDEVSIEFPEGRPRRDPSRGAGKSVIVLFVAGVLLGAGALGAGFMLGLGQAAPPAPHDPGRPEFTLRALITGYVGVGGSIDGQQNPTLRVNQGDEVTIILVGGEDVVHNLVIDEFSVETDLIGRTGERSTVTFVADRAGTFSYYCSLPGHRLLGMEGRLVVGAGGGQTGPGPAKPVDVGEIAKHPRDLPPPLNRNVSATVHLYMEAREVVAEIEDGTTFSYWTFNGTVPGPFFRVRVNDTVVVHFRNAPSSGMNHSVDFHAVTGPGGGAVATQTPPGQETSFTFKALNPGIYVYHCASPHIPSHISMGMYGLILVEPEGGLPPVDKEFYVMQGDMYTRWPAHSEGHQEFDDAKMLAENPTYVVFNGRWQALTGANALMANVNETVRIFFGVGGPNLMSSFHVIGEIFDRVFIQGDLVSPPKQSIQTTLAMPGGAVVVDFKVEVPGTYILVDHALSRTIDKGSVGLLIVSGPPNPEVYR